MKNAHGEILYVGKAKNLFKRLQQYFTLKDTRASIASLMPQVAHIETIIVNNEKEALILENNLIKQHHPKYNILLKDDKTFIAIMITHHKWPQIKTVRCKSKKHGLYFGPYTQAEAAKNTLELILKLFPLRQCSDHDFATRSRPCVLYGMKKCLAPCVNKCSHEEYMENVKQAILLLQGKNKEIVTRLKKQMQNFSQNQEFEKAALCLKQLKQLEHIFQNQYMENIKIYACDVFGYHQQNNDLMLCILSYRNGKLLESKHFTLSLNFATISEALGSFILQYYQNNPQKTKEILLPIKIDNNIPELLNIHIFYPQKGTKHELLLLAQKNASMLVEEKQKKEILAQQKLLNLKKILKLKRYPQNIYCFDSSSFAGKDFVAAIVCFENGEKQTKKYRLFKIKGEKKDEFSALNEVILRFFNHHPTCDLLLLDGGSLQLNATLRLLKAQHIENTDVIAICKEEARHDKGLTKEKIFLSDSTIITMNVKDPVLLFLQRIRDEAHRFAISFHHKKQKERMLTSSLDAIEGIGPKKKLALLNKFKSVENIKKASDEALMLVPGITSKDINNIRKFYFTSALNK